MTKYLKPSIGAKYIEVGGLWYFQLIVDDVEIMQSIRGYAIFKECKLQCRFLLKIFGYEFVEDENAKKDL